MMQRPKRAAAAAVPVYAADSEDEEHESGSDSPKEKKARKAAAPRAPKEAKAVKLFAAAADAPRFAALHPGGAADLLEAISTTGGDAGVDYKTAKDVLAALNAGSDFFAVGAEANACINLADMAALGWTATPEVRFAKGAKTVTYAIVDGKAVTPSSKEAKAAEKARAAAAKA